MKDCNLASVSITAKSCFSVTMNTWNGEKLVHTYTVVSGFLVPFVRTLHTAITHVIIVVELQSLTANCHWNLRELSGSNTLIT